MTDIMTRDSSILFKAVTNIFKTSNLDKTGLSNNDTVHCCSTYTESTIKEKVKTAS